MAHDNGMDAAKAAGYAEADLHAMVKDYYGDHHQQFDCYPVDMEIYDTPGGEELDEAITLSFDECTNLLDEFGWPETSAAPGPA